MSNHRLPSGGDFTAEELAAIPDALSAARFGRYLLESHGDRARALNLYAWNALVSAAFKVPLELLEVVVRNAIVKALERGYPAEGWHESKTFEFDLPDRQQGYSPRKDLADAKVMAAAQVEKAHKAALRRAHKMSLLRGQGAKPASSRVPSGAPVGKVIAELRFAFWVSLLTSSHHLRLWKNFLYVAFPHLPMSEDNTEAARRFVHDEIDAVRNLRNRVAHHEPVFYLDLQKEYLRIHRIIGWRCPITAGWLERIQEVGALLAARPQ